MLDELLKVGFLLHGHRCPAMPLGLRAGLRALEVLGVERARDKELFCISETGSGHAASCFLDGVMVATGCTYGKGNVIKRYWGKMAFTLIDVKKEKAVRVSLRPEFFEKALESPFIQMRKKGIPPHEIPPDVLNPILEKILSMPYDEFLLVSEVFPYRPEKRVGCFTAFRCEICGEMVFENFARIKDGRKVCIPCSGYRLFLEDPVL